MVRKFKGQETEEHSISPSSEPICFRSSSLSRATQRDLLSSWGPGALCLLLFSSLEIFPIYTFIQLLLYNLHILCFISSRHGITGRGREETRRGKKDIAREARTEMAQGKRLLLLLLLLL
jgi:hypothetical protein